MIIKQLTSGLLLVFAKLTSALLTVLTLPVARLVVTLMPDAVDNYDTAISTFFNDYLFKGLAFAREVFFNLTGYPRTLFYALIFIFMGKLALRSSFIIFRFLIKIYYMLPFIHGSHVDT